MSRRLDLFGTVHIDRRSKVESELADYVEEADAIFVERPTDEARDSASPRSARRFSAACSPDSSSAYC